MYKIDYKLIKVIIIGISFCLITCNVPLLPPDDEKGKASSSADSVNSHSITEIANEDSVSTENEIVKNAQEIFQENSKSTVTIFTDNDQLGSGFFIKPDLIVTNYHVVDGARKVQFRTIDSDRTFDIDGFVSINKGNDLALLKTTEMYGMPLTISQRDIAEGEPVYVIGSPQGLSATISDGIISGKRNMFDNNLIQITAPISPGSSGGPVFNRFGEVVGVAVLQSKQGQNLNFAIPSKEINLMIEFQANHSRTFSSLLSEEKIASSGEPTDINLENPSQTQLLDWTDEIKEALFKDCLKEFKDKEDFGFTFDFCKCMTSSITSNYTPQMFDSISEDEWRKLVEGCAESAREQQ